MKLRNLGGLYVVQITNTVLPLLTVPYLARTLGVEGFGLLSWTFAATFLVVLATDSGINGVAIRALIRCRDCTARVQKIFTTVQVVRLSLAALGSGVLWVIVMSVGVASEKMPLLAAGMLNVLGTLSFPTYYYVAMEKSEHTAWLHFTGRCIAVGLVFVLVRGPEDVAIALALQSGATLLSGLLAHLLRGPHRLPTYGPFSLRIARILIRRAVPSYLPEIQIHAMASVPVLILGALASAIDAGVYALCDKIARTGSSLFQPILHAMLPRWTKSNPTVAPSISTLIHEPLLARVGIVAVCAGVVLFAGATYWVQIVAGSKFSDVSTLGMVLRLLAIWMTLHTILRVIEVRVFVASGRTGDYWRAMRLVLSLQWAGLVLGASIGGAVGGAAAIALCELFFVWRLSGAIRHLR